VRFIFIPTHGDQPKHLQKPATEDLRGRTAQLVKKQVAAIEQDVFNNKFNICTGSYVQNFIKLDQMIALWLLHMFI